MKKHKLKFNNSRFVARVMLIIFLLTSALGLSGCEEHQGYPTEKYILNIEEKGYFSQLKMIATSNTQVFDKNDITLNLSYSMHASSTKGESSLNNKGDGYSNKIENYDLKYCIYITDFESFCQIKNEGPHEFKDITKINNHLLVNQVSEEEALSQEYLRVYPKFAIGNGAEIYNHTESVTIPREFVLETSGRFVVVLVAFVWSEEDQSYYAYRSSRIEFDYVEINEDTVRIDMEKRYLYFIIP